MVFRITPSVFVILSTHHQNLCPPSPVYHHMLDTDGGLYWSVVEYYRVYKEYQLSRKFGVAAVSLSVH